MQLWRFAPVVAALVTLGAGTALAQEPAVVVAGDSVVEGRRLARVLEEFDIVFVRDGVEQGGPRVVDELAMAELDGKPVLVRVQYVRRGDAVLITDSSFMDPTTLAPIRHLSHAAHRVIALDFEGRAVTGTVTRPNEEPEAVDWNADVPLFDSSTIDLVLRALPLAAGRAWRVPSYIHESGGTVWTTLRVVGTERIDLASGPVDTWKAEVDWGNDRVTTYWVDRTTRDLVWMESAANGGTIRYVPVGR